MAYPELDRFDTRHGDRCRAGCENDLSMAEKAQKSPVWATRAA